MTSLNSSLAPLGALSGVTLRVWRLVGTEWTLVAGSGGEHGPRAPRSTTQESATFAVIPESDGLFLEVVPDQGHAAGDLLARLMPIVQALAANQQSVNALTSELADRYEEIDLLYSIGEMLGHAHSIDQVASFLLREVTGVVGARRAGLRIYDEAAGVLRSVALLNTDPDLVAAEVPIDAPDSVVVARAFRSRRIATGPQPGWVPGEILAVPIIYAASGQPPRVVGTLALADRAGGGAFTREETKLVAAVATQVGAAIENARLVVHEHERLRMARELELAHDLQVKLMPTAAALSGQAEVAVHSVPAETLGGDFYTFARLGEGRIGVMVGDVSSHGFAAALIAAQVMAAAGIHAHADASPSETLGLLRGSLADELTTTEMYLSLVYAVVDPRGGTLQWSNAGHPYAWRLPAEGPAQRLASTAPPLGLVEDSQFDDRSMPWQSGQDILVMVTDGLTDQPRADGKRYGEGRLLARLESGRGLDPSALLEWLQADLRDFGGVATDDVTILILRI